MKVTVEGFIIAKQYDWEDAPTFTWLPFKPTFDRDYVIIAPHTITYDIPDGFDMRPARIAELERQKADAKAKFAAEINRIDDAIQKLLALPGIKEVQS